MELKPGKQSTEWKAVLGVGALAAAQMLMSMAKSMGLIPEDATVESLGEQVVDIAKNNGGILVFAAIAWAYIKRRSALKGRQ